MRGRTRAGLVVAIGVVAALVAACAPLPPPPAFPGYGGAVSPYGGPPNECRHVLTVGDSLVADELFSTEHRYEAMWPHLEGILEGSGRCTTVTNVAVGGFSSAHVLQYLPDHLGDAEAEGDEVDVAVIELVGNDHPDVLPWSSPDWAERTIANARAITDLLRASGIQVYWVVPPITRFGCDTSDPSKPWNNGKWATWNAWLRDTLLTEYPSGDVHVVDWRTPFGGEAYSGAFVFPDGSTQVLRRSDCTHFTVTGGWVAAYITAIGIQGEWPEPVASPTDEPSTTTTSAPEPVTTTTEATTTSTTITPVDP